MINKIIELFTKKLPPKSSDDADIQKNVENMLDIIENRLGHGKSYLSKTAKLSNGMAVPWFTYPAIEFLNSLDISKMNIFEYGSGVGTQYWRKQSKKVISVESNKEWFNKNKTSGKNIVLYRNDKNEYVNSINQAKILFDVVVVDGEYRYECTKAAVKRIKKSGIIILDNSEWYPKTSKLLRSLGFKQIDFSGFGPVVYFTWKTSFFLKSLDGLKYRDKNYIPVGSFKHTVNPE